MASAALPRRQGALGSPLDVAAGAAAAVLAARAADAEAPCFTGDVLPREMWTSDDPDDLQIAKQVCRTCPLWDACTAYGGRYKPRSGQWGRYRYTERSKP